MTTQSVFNADLERFNAAFRDADALITDDDGSVWIDTTKVDEALVSAYTNLHSYGYANGLL